MASNSGDSDGPPPTRKRRTDMSPYEDTLEESWQAGMKNYKADGKRLAEAAATRTGLHIDRVKVWITNRNRRESITEQRKKAEESGKEDGNPFGNKKTGYDLFRRDTMKGKRGPQVVGETGLAWSRLKVEDPDRYKHYVEQAEAMERPSLEKASEDAKKKAILKLWRDIEDITEKLQSLDCECYAMMFDGGREGGVWSAHTSIAQEFFGGLSDNIELDFQAAVRARKPQTSGTDEESDVDRLNAAALDKEVRQSLNGIAEVTPGLGQRKFPYRKLKDREVSLEGLPAEVNLKNLHNMGTDRLRLVLKNKDNIRIHVVDENEASQLSPPTLPTESEDLQEQDSGDSPNVEQELLHLQQAIQHSAQGQREEVTLQQEEQGGDGAVGTSTCSGQGERRGAFSLIEALSKK